MDLSLDLIHFSLVVFDDAICGETTSGLVGNRTLTGFMDQGRASLARLCLFCSIVSSIYASKLGGRFLTRQSLYARAFLADVCLESQIR